MSESINVKEFWAVAKVLEVLPYGIRDCRVHCQVDNQAVLHTWTARGVRSRAMNVLAKRIFLLTQQRNVHLHMTYIPLQQNPADGFSRKLTASDPMPAPCCWEGVQKYCGGPRGHNLVFMSLDSNVQRDKHGVPLPHFTPHPTPASKGVDLFSQKLPLGDTDSLNPYCPPPSV